jgi:hypothetical protein
MEFLGGVPHNYFMRTKFLILLSVILSLSLITAPSNAAVKAGAKCTKAGTTATAAGKKFTCVKSGTRLVWNKGVAVKAAPKPSPNPVFKPVEPTPTPTPVVTPTPTPTPETPLPREGSQCPAIGNKVSNSTGAMRCSWAGHANTTEEAKERMIWLKFVEYKTSTSQSNSYTSTPLENASCTNSGDTFDVAGGKLECRWVTGKKLQWIKINTVKKTFTNAKSPVSIDVCKLQMSASKADRTGRNSGAGQVGFPLVNSDKNGMFINGINEVLIVPVDFPDFQGGPELKAQLDYDKKMLVEWYDYFSNGKSKFNVTTINQWLRLPGDRSAYPTDSKSTNALAADSTTRQGNQAQAFIDEITKVIDLRKFSTVYLFYPDGNYAMSDLIVRNHQFKIKEGLKNMNFFSWGRNLEGMQSLKWAYYIHETLHDFNIIGHAPGNGWPLGNMTNQAGYSQAINPWEQFLLDWLPSDQIYCDDFATMKPITLSLSPVEREDKQTKMAVIKLSPTKAIVVESHGIDKWSDLNAGGRAFPPGFYSVMAYVVDLDKAVAPPTNNDGSSQPNDDWAWAVWQKVLGGPSHNFNFQYFNWNKLNDHVAVLGDSFVIEGVRIKFVGTGDYETIEISKA